MNFENKFQLKIGYKGEKYEVFQENTIFTKTYESINSIEFVQNFLKSDKSCLGLELDIYFLKELSIKKYLILYHYFFNFNLTYNYIKRINKYLDHLNSNNKKNNCELTQYSEDTCSQSDSQCNFVAENEVEDGVEYEVEDEYAYSQTDSQCNFVEVFEDDELDSFEYSLEDNNFDLYIDDKIIKFTIIFDNDSDEPVRYKKEEDESNECGSVEFTIPFNKTLALNILTQLKHFLVFIYKINIIRIFKKNINEIFNDEFNNEELPSPEELNKECKRENNNDDNDDDNYHQSNYENFFRDNY